MIGLTISTRKPRNDDTATYQSLEHNGQYYYQTPDGISLNINNTSGKHIYLKWRI